MCLKSILFLVNREAQKLKSVKRSSHFEKIVNRAKIPCRAKSGTDLSKKGCYLSHWLFLYWRRIICLGELGQAYLVRLMIRLSINTGTKTNYPSRRFISVVRL